MTSLISLWLLVAAFGARQEVEPHVIEHSTRALTVCEVIATPLEFNGRTITVRGSLIMRPEGRWIESFDCPSTFSTDGYMWPNIIALATPNSRDGRRLGVRSGYPDRSDRHLLKRVSKLRKRVPERCIEATYTGVFDTRSDWSKAVLKYSDGSRKYAGFGHLSEAPGQLILKSLDRVNEIPGCGK